MLLPFNTNGSSEAQVLLIDTVSVVYDDELEGCNN